MWRAVARCAFAHDLRDLNPPNEGWGRRECWSKAWENGQVDRWYGQKLTDDQLRRIQAYYDEANQSVARRMDIPNWAHAVAWYYGRMPNWAHGQFPPWVPNDFGMYADWNDLIRVRGEVYFKYHGGFWDALRQRVAAAERQRQEEPRLAAAAAAANQEREWPHLAAAAAAAAAADQRCFCCPLAAGCRRRYRKWPRCLSQGLAIST